MSERESEKTGPSHRVSFARIDGEDRSGKDILGPAREVGSIWPRKGKEGEGILRFDHIPEEMRARGGGVLFVKMIEARQERGEPDTIASQQQTARGDQQVGDLAPARRQDRGFDRDR